MKKQDLPITYISFKDFSKLGLKGYEHRKHYYDKDGKRLDEDKAFACVPDQIIDGILIPSHKQSIYSYVKICWEEVDLTKKVAEEFEYIKEEFSDELDKYICLAIHKDIPEEEFIKKYDDLKGALDLKTGLPITDSQREERAFQTCLYDYSYLDKFLTIFGAQTYLLGFGISKLYSIRDYYETRDDYFRIPKKTTKAIYLIKY